MTKKYRANFHFINVMFCTKIEINILKKCRWNYRRKKKYKQLAILYSYVKK